MADEHDRSASPETGTAPPGGGASLPPSDDARGAREAPSGERAGAAPDEAEEGARLAEGLRAQAAAYAELHERYLRTTADLQNVRKRAERDIEDRARRKAEGLLRAILGGIDELDRALERIPADRRANDPLAAGVVMIRQILHQACVQEGVQEIPTVGSAFDPKLHEALASAPAADVPPGHVVAEHRKGYLWGDRVLRPSQVIVAMAPSPAKAPE